VEEHPGDTYSYVNVFVNEKKFESNLNVTAIR
jgi:hypothetical protein